MENASSVHINRYDEYGVPDPGNQGRFQFTGQAWLGEFGLYHYKARVYNPDIGRFMQTDPIGYEDQMNLYAYVGNDPVNGTDPSGRQTTAKQYWDRLTQGSYASETLGSAAVDTLDASSEFLSEASDIANGIPDGAPVGKGLSLAAEGMSAIAGVAKAGRAAQLASNVAQGAAAEAKVVAKLGENVAGRRVTLESSTTGRKSVVDIVTKEKGAVEVKSGGARLSNGQRDVQADIAAGKNVIPRGGNAADSGLTPNQPTKMTCYTVDRC